MSACPETRASVGRCAGRPSKGQVRGMDLPGGEGLSKCLDLGTWTHRPVIHMETNSADLLFIKL